jgi:hypothetical protein
MSSDEIIIAILSVLLLLVFLFMIVRGMRALKMTREEVKRVSRFYLIIFIPLYVFLLIEIYINSALSLRNTLIISLPSMFMVLVITRFYYLPHVVDPRLKREYGITLEYFQRYGSGNSIEKYRK